jgi:hypothetical protein
MCGRGLLREMPEVPTEKRDLKAQNQVDVRNPSERSTWFC